jgi:hypothetical protein
MNEILARARPIVERIANPYATAMLMFTEGFAAYQFGRYAQGFEQLSRASELFRTTCTGASHDAAVSDRFALDSLFHVGELGEMTRRHALLLEDAERRGDLYLAAELRTGLPNVTWLSLDQPDEARASNELGIAPWSQRSFYLQHYYHALAAAQIALYEGDGEGALAIVEAAWPKMRASFLLKIQAVRAEALYLRARAAIAAGAHAIAEKAARQLTGEAVPSALGLATAARAGIAASRGDRERGLTLLRSARESLGAAGVAMLVAACGIYLDDPESEGWMRAHGAVEPHRFAALLLPGFAHVLSSRTA